MAAWFKSNVWQAVAFLWGVAEATLFFIVPDVLLSAIGLKRGARAGAVASACAALGAGAGGAAMFLWSAHDAAGARAVVLAVPAVSEAMAADAARAMAEHGWFAATLAGPLSFTPFKLYAILAPEAGASAAGFALASVAARLPRFLLVSSRRIVAARAVGGEAAVVALRGLGAVLRGVLRACFQLISA